jgi:hypothetical protein
VDSGNDIDLMGAQDFAPRHIHLHLQFRTWVYLGLRTGRSLGQWSSLTTSRLNEVLEVGTVPREAFTTIVKRITGASGLWSPWTSAYLLCEPNFGPNGSADHVATLKKRGARLRPFTLTTACDLER